MDEQNLAPRVITFSGPREGVGKTSVVMNLALAWANYQKRNVLVLPLDPMCRVEHAQLLGLNPPSMAEIVKTLGRESVGALGALLKQRMVDTYPQLADIRIESSWSGKMAYAKHLMPQIGKLDDGLWYCMSFGGHGMNTTAIGGTVIAEAILGQSDRYTLFSPFGLEWNGGVAGTAAVQLTYWYYQLCDFLQERKSQRLN